MNSIGFKLSALSELCARYFFRVALSEFRDSKFAIRNPQFELPVLEVPIVRYFWCMRVHPQHFLGIVRLGGAVREDHHLVAIGFISIGDPGRNLDENIIVFPQEDFLKFAAGKSG